MTETDDLAKRLRRYSEGSANKVRDPLDIAAQEAAARLERQSTALTASQETIDNLRDENERLRKALEESEGRLDGYEMDVRESGER